MGLLTLLLCDSPYQHESVDEAIDIAQEALNQGHQVHMFLMMDGVNTAHLKQIGEPLGVEAPSTRLTELIQDGAQVFCSRVCMELRGISEEEIPNGVEVSGLFDLSESIAGSDTVLTFARRG